MQEQAGRKGFEGMPNKMKLKAAGHKTARSCYLLEAGALLGQTHEEFKVHQIAAMTGSSLNHHRAAMEHVSAAVNHPMTRRKSACLGCPVLPSPVHGITLCCRGQALPVRVSVGILCSTGGHRISRAMLQVVNNTTSALSTTRPLLGSRISFNL